MRRLVAGLILSLFVALIALGIGYALGHFWLSP